MKKLPSADEINARLRALTEELRRARQAEAKPRGSYMARHARALAADRPRPRKGRQRKG